MLSNDAISMRRANLFIPLPGSGMRYPGNATSFTATRDGERHAHPALPVQTAPRCVVLPGNDALRILLPGNAASFTATRDSQPPADNDALSVHRPHRRCSVARQRCACADCTPCAPLLSNEAISMHRANLFDPLPGRAMRYPGNATSFTATLPH